jgi:hypothetical protein
MFCGQQKGKDDTLLHAIMAWTNPAFPVSFARGTHHHRMCYERQILLLDAGHERRGGTGGRREPPHSSQLLRALSAFIVTWIAFTERWWMLCQNCERSGWRQRTYSSLSCLDAAHTPSSQSWCFFDTRMRTPSQKPAEANLQATGRQGGQAKKLGAKKEPCLIITIADSFSSFPPSPRCFRIVVACCTSGGSIMILGGAMLLLLLLPLRFQEE